MFIIQIRINNKVIIRPWERIGMKKKLLEMTKEELRRLFPIFLVPHKKEWRDVFAEEKGVLTSFLKDIKLLRIEHIGSTAIPDIYAKDIIDILIYVEEKDFVRAESIFKENGYILMYQKETTAAFNKGYTEDGFAEKVFHVHLRTRGDIDELYFRDYLLEFLDVAKEYESLKLKLWKQ